MEINEKRKNIGPADWVRSSKNSNSIGADWLAKYAVSQTEKDPIIMARALSKVGKISDIISQAKAPKPIAWGQEHIVMAKTIGHPVTSWMRKTPSNPVEKNHRNRTHQVKRPAAYSVD